MFDALAMLYQGQYQTASFLQYLKVINFQVENTQFGGIGRGKYQLYAKTEDLGNLVAPNRLDLYIKRDTVTSSISANATSINVHYGSRFAVGQGIAVYDGITADTSIIQSISGNTLTVSPAIIGAHNLGSTILVLRHTGRISAVDADTNLQNIQNVETQSYFQELADFVSEVNITNKECGWALYNILQKYASSLDMVISSSNFVMDSTGDGTGGTGVKYTATNGEVSLMSVIQEIITTASGNGNATSNVTYSFYVDEHNVLHFGPLQKTTPTASFDLVNYGTDYGDGLFDVVRGHTFHDQDLTLIKNTYKIVGGTYNTSNANVTARVFDQNSVNQYGQKEAVLSNPSITDVNTLAAWGQGKLNQTAYPGLTFKTEIYPSLTYLTCQDFVRITGFTDSSTQQYNIQSVSTEWDAETMNGQILQRIVGAEILPDINRVMRQIAAEHYIPVVGVTAGGVNLTDRFVQNGLEGFYSGNTFSINGGVINALINVGGTNTLTEFDVGTAGTVYFTYSPTTDDTYTIAYLYRNADGTAITSPHMVTFQGLTVPQGQGYTDYQILPMWTLTRLGGNIVNGTDRRNIGGIHTANINAGQIGNKQLAPNPNLNTAPTLHTSTTVTTPTYPSVGGGSYDASITFQLSIANPNWLSEARLYAVPANQAYKTYRIFKGDLTPSSTGTYIALYGGLAAGTAYDLYVTFVDQGSNECQDVNGIPLGLYLATTTQNLISYTSFPALPQYNTPTVSVSVPLPPSSIAYPNAGGATYDAQTAVTFTNLLNGTMPYPYIREIEIVAQPSNQSNNWTVYNTLTVGNNATLSLVWGGLGAGNTYTLGVRYKDGGENRGTILTLGTTVANPIQGSAIGTGAVGVGQTTGIFDTNGQIIYNKNSPQVQVALNPDGTVNASQITGLLPLGINSSQVQQTVTVTSTNGTGGGATYLNPNAVSTNQIQTVSVISTQIAKTKYNTSLLNAYNGYNVSLWYSDGTVGFGPGPIGSTTIPNGASAIYDVGNATYTGNANPQVDTMYLAAGCAALFTFKHNAYTAGGQGQIKVGFAGQAVGSGANSLNSPLVGGSDQPAISHSTSTSTTEVLQTHPIPSTTSSPTVVQTANGGTYTNTQHNGGTVTGSGSSGSITGGTGYSQQTTSAVSVSTSILYSTSGTIGDDGTTSGFAQATNANISYGASNSFATAVGDGAHAVTLNYNLPASISWLNSYSAYTTTNPINGSVVHHIGGSTGRTAGIAWTISCYLGTTLVYGPVANITGNSSISFNPTSGTGTYSWRCQPQFTTDGVGSPDGSGTPSATASVSDYYSSGSYTANAGAYTGVSSTTSAAVAPVDAAHQIEIDITSLTNYTAPGGAFYVNPVLINPQGGVAQDFGIVTNGQVLTYYNAAATSGTYQLQYRAVFSGTPSGTGSGYAPSFTCLIKWYQNDSNSTTYTYTPYAGQITSFYTDNNSNIDSPSNGATPVGVTITSLSVAVGSGSNGAYISGGLFMNVFAPNGALLVSNQALTATGTYTYSNTGAVAGQYRFELFGLGSGSGGPGTQTLNVTYAGNTFDYNHVVGGSTVYLDNSGQNITHLTAPSTLAPTGSGTQLTLDLTSVTCPSNAYGSTYLVVTLTSPSGTNLTFNYNAHYNSTTGTANGNVGFQGATTLTYYAGGAAAGVYTWTVYGQAASNSTGDSTYSVSYSGTQSYYTAGVSGGNTYILGSDGITQRTACNDQDVNFVSLTPGSLSFYVYNNASQTVGFNLSVETTGV